MLVAVTKEERIIKIYLLLKRELRRYKKSISLPKKTDPTKTYSWRYLERFLDRVETSGFNDDDMPIIIEAIVNYAYENRLLNRGIAILDQKNILEVVSAKLEKEAKEENDITRTITTSRSFVRKQLPQNSSPEQVRILLAQRPNRTAYTNITRWFKSNQISIGYIAVSRECKKALGTLPNHELELFPQPRELMRMRLQLISNPNIVTKLKTVLGNDLVED